MVDAPLLSQDAIATYTDVLCIILNPGYLAQFPHSYQDTTFLPKLIGTCFVALKLGPKCPQLNIPPDVQTSQYLAPRFSSRDLLNHQKQSFMLAKEGLVATCEHQKTWIAGALVHSGYIFSPYVSREEKSYTTQYMCSSKHIKFIAWH